MVGCGSRYPRPIDLMVSSNASVSDIQQGLATDKGVTVRWGGVIANVNNQEKDTWVEVVQLPLKNSGRPRDTDISTGRFLVKIEGFLDPAIYAAGREFTVVGILSGMSEGKVGEFDYKFPVVASQGYYLWKQVHEADYYHAYLYPVSYWRPYLPYYYPIYHRYPIPRRRSNYNSSRRVEPNPTVNPPAVQPPATRPPPRPSIPSPVREQPKNKKMR